MAWDGEKFGQAIVEQVNASIDRVVAPLIKRLDELETQQLKWAKDADVMALEQRLRDDIDRFDASLKHAVTAEQIKDLRGELEQTIGPELQIALSKMVEEIPPAPAGKDAEPIDMSVVKQMIADEVASLPPAPAGKDADPIDMDAVKSIIAEMIPAPVAPELPDIVGMIDEAMPDIKSMIKEAVDELPVPKDGKDADPVDMDDIRRSIQDLFDGAVKAYRDEIGTIPVPRDGKDVDMDAVKSMIAEMIPAPIAGKDGADVVDAIIGKDDHLHLTLSNGTVKDVGRVVGWDGVDCDIDGVWKILNEKLAALPPAADGKDGMGFDDLSVEYDGERTFKFVLARGDERKTYEFAVPMVIYRETFKEDADYAKGDAVTWDGSMWIAQIDGAKQKPGHLGNKEWRLAVKKGIRGKDGVTITPRPNEPVKLGGR